MIREIVGLLFVFLGLVVIVTLFVVVGWWGLLFLPGSLLVAVGLGLMIHRADVTEGTEDLSDERVDAPR